MYLTPCAGVMTQRAQLKLPSQGLGSLGDPIRPNQAARRVYVHDRALAGEGMGAYLTRRRALAGELSFIGPYPAPGRRLGFMGAERPLRVRRMRLRGLGQAATASFSYLPQGSQLIYSVDFAVPTLSNPLATPASVAAQVAQNVQQHSGLLVIGNDASGNAFAVRAGYDLTIQLNQPYNNPEQVKQVLDDAQNGTGFAVVDSSITVASVAGAPAGSTVAIPGGNAAPALPGEPGYLGPAGSAPPAQQTFSEWIGANWYWFALAGVGFVAVKEML